MTAAAPPERAPAVAEAYPSLATGGTLLALCMVAYALSLFDRQILSLMVDLVKPDLGLTDFQIGLLQGLAFATFYSLLTIPIGGLADRVSRTNLIACGIFVWSCATIACGLVDGFPGMFLARMVVGIGEAALVPAAYSLISDSFDRKHLVRATAVFAFGALSGIGLALLLGGYLVNYVTTAAEPPFGLVGYAPWRIVFFAAGAPGVLVSILFFLVPEPTRKDLVRTAEGVVVSPRIATTFRFIWSRRRIYVPLYAAPVILGTITYGGIYWFPAFLTRNFGLTFSQVGAYGGIIQTSAALVGAFVGPALVERFAARGHRDAHLRALLVVAIATIVPSATATLMTSFPIMLGLWSLNQLCLCSYLAIAMAALQLRTPNQMRAVNSGLAMCLSGLVGAGLGAPAVGAITQFVFKDTHALGYGLSILGLVCAPLAAILIWWGLKAHREDQFLASGGPAPAAGGR